MHLQAGDRYHLWISFKEGLQEQRRNLSEKKPVGSACRLSKEVFTQLILKSNMGIIQLYFLQALSIYLSTDFTFLNVLICGSYLENAREQSSLHHPMWETCNFNSFKLYPSRLELSTILCTIDEVNSIYNIG